MQPKSGDKVRPPAWAGAFYPGEPAELKQTVTALLDEAPVRQQQGQLMGLIVPHAGYIYSGATAAVAYKLLRSLAVRTVLVLAPSHAVLVEGVSVYNGDYYATPLGNVPVDTALVQRLATISPLIHLSVKGHAASGDRAEHSLEVQLPFLQVALPQPFQIVPMVFHDYRQKVCKLLGNALAQVWQEDMLVVASSDLYHGYSYPGCHSSDERTLQAIQAQDVDRFCEGIEAELYQACGAGPIAALLYCCTSTGANKVSLLHHTTSADITGKKGDWTVGYASLSVSRC
jgi:AmmeMemoRadiSam system protein B